MSDEKAPPLKLEPKYGYFPRWPENGDQWLNPEDAPLARQVLPSLRVWRREGQEDGYHILRYGRLALRVRPALWQEVPTPRFHIGDMVEVRTRLMKNEPRTGAVREVIWDERQSQHVYQIEEQGAPVDDHYSAADLKPVAPASNREEVRIDVDTRAASEGVDEITEGLPRDENFGKPPE